MCRIEPGIDLLDAPDDGTIRPLLRLVAISSARMEFGGGAAFDGPAKGQLSCDPSELRAFGEMGMFCMFFSSILGSK